MYIYIIYIYIYTCSTSRQSPARMIPCKNEAESSAATRGRKAAAIRPSAAADPPVSPSEERHRALWC